VDGNVGGGGTLNIGSFELEGFEETSEDDPGVDLECDAYDFGEEDLENGPSPDEMRR
jgi:hypothetical protein